MALFFRRGDRRPHSYGKELKKYRSDLEERTSRIDAVLADLVDAIDALRRRDLDVEDAVARLASAEDELDAVADELREMLAPEELHPLHDEYEANLESALRGNVTA
jgi:ABC-type transporter Mla subunit MlaD